MGRDGVSRKSGYPPKCRCPRRWHKSSTVRKIQTEGENGMSDDGIFLRNSWYVAAWNHELIDGRKLARTLLERPVVIYRGASGRVIALDDRCCHRAAPLSMGRIEGDDIRCM